MSLNIPVKKQANEPTKEDSNDPSMEMDSLHKSVSLSVVGRFDNFNYNKNEVKLGRSVALSPINEQKLEQHIIKVSSQHMKWVIQHTLAGIVFILIMLILPKYIEITFSETLGIIVFFLIQHIY